MKFSDSNIAGLVLAAGASNRMKDHKALLQLKSGDTLLSHQVKALADGGCRPITVLIGADAEAIMSRHASLNVQWAKNHEWELGQFSSLQAGIRKILRDNSQGAIILPVDAAGVATLTISEIIATALRNPHLHAVVPEFEDRGGHPIYISRDLFERIAELDPASDEARLDALLKKEKLLMRLPVNDRNILRNINTPEDWERIRGELGI